MKTKFLIAFILSAGFMQGCAKLDSAGKTQNSSTSVVVDPPTTDPDVVTKAEPMVQIADIAGLRPSLAQVLGIEPVSSNWNFLLSTDGGVSGMSGPMQMGFTSISGEACDALILKEARLAAADRKFFKDIDFKLGPSQQKPGAVASTVRALSRAVWMRNERLEEMAIITNAMKVFDGETTPALTNQQMLILCSAMTAALPATIR